MQCNLFLELIPIVFKIPGVTCFMTEKLSQDPLEKFFGCQRQQDNTNDNPEVHEFLTNTQSLRVIDSINVHQITGNCRGTKRKHYDLDTVDLSRPLNHVVLNINTLLCIYMCKCITGKSIMNYIS